MNNISDKQKEIVTNLVIDISLICRDVDKTYQEMISRYYRKYVPLKDAWWLEYNDDVKNLLQDIMNDIHDLWFDVNSHDIYGIDEIEERLHNILVNIIHNRKMFAYDGFVYRGYNSLYDLIIDSMKEFKDFA